MAYTVPLDELAPTADRMPPLLARYQADRAAMDRRYCTPDAPQHRERLRAFLEAWQEAACAVPFDDLSPDDRADLLLFRNLLAAQLRKLDREAALFAEMKPLVPFAPDLVALDVARRDHRDADPPDAAARLDRACAAVRDLTAKLEAVGTEPPVTGAVAMRAAGLVDRLAKTVGEWHAFYAEFDPAFTWWTARPHEAAQAALKEYAALLRERLAGGADPDTIVGDPIGRDALLAELAEALIPYTPEELVSIARREQDWCEAELRRAARDMGMGDDWRSAMEVVKDRHAPPGGQPALVRDLAREAIAYVEEHDLVTVPPLARDGWRMEMMPPERQKVNPFFLGGETIIVSFPTTSMDQAQKRMSLRGNNRHFSRATVQHELIPGHYLQMYSQERYRPYRRIFYTPFWTEGWTMHWEMLLWDLGFPQSPEDRIGMLFWRMHRCARVRFSLGFHLGQVSAAECVDMLVDEYGHERDNAAGEVRRSFGGDYGPLYQLAYLMGGLQVRALHRELVGGGRLTHRQFHDGFLRRNCMPVAVARALLSGLPLGSELPANWRFYEGL